MEMDIVVSLEALIEKATSGQSKTADKMTVDAICGLLRRHPTATSAACRQLALRAQSTTESEALHALNVLDICMNSCGTNFHSEVGKFRFLNELIKVVSPKFLGNRTPSAVRGRVLELLGQWTVSYPNETKIREAFDMLRRQGVVSDLSPPPIVPPSKPNTQLFRDEEFEKKLQKLLASKNTEDLEAANKMIKSRVLETEKRTIELERIKSSVKLLNEMTQSANPSTEDLQLMMELRGECERLRPNLYRMAAETTDSATLAEILFVSDELSSVLDQHSAITSHKGSNHLEGNPEGNASLLDLSSPGSSILSSDNLIGDTKTSEDFFLPSLDASVNGKTIDAQPDLESLVDFFQSTTKPSTSIQRVPNTIAPMSPPDVKSNKQKALEELDLLGESMLLQCKLESQTNGELTGKSIDTTLLLISDDQKPEDTHVQPLTDICVSLDEITVSDLPPIPAINIRGISITLYIAKNKPREDVTVVVVTTTSTNQNAISNLLFQAIVPQECKVKLLAPSGTSLPGFKPFLPPAAISQVMLIARPKDSAVNLKCVVSFNLNGETVTELGEVADLPSC